MLAERAGPVRLLQHRGGVRDEHQQELEPGPDRHPLDQSAEAVNDRAKLLLPLLLARGLAREPGLIEAARSRLDPSADAPDHVREWEELLRLEHALIRRALVSRSERMTRLRLSSPFFQVSGLQDTAFRRRVWRLARRGSVSTAYPAGKTRF